MTARPTADQGVTSVEELESRLATPSPGLIADLGKLDGDILVLGAGGKLGPSLVRLAVNAVRESGSGKTVTAVSRFSDRQLAIDLESCGARVVRADVSSEAGLRSLPDAANVIYLVGAKFGTSGDETKAWLTNTYLVGQVVQRFSGRRIVALSTGNVYPLSASDGSGSSETDQPGPVGEYAMSCLGRERVMSGLCARTGTPGALIRLNYAVELRYGVLIDLAGKIARGEPIDLTMGYVNIVWQGYANEVTLRMLSHTASPTAVLNVTGREVLSVRALAEELGKRLGRAPDFIGSEAETALLSDARRCHELFGPPSVDLSEILDWTADWVAAGRPLLGKPTGFERRNGQF